MKRIRFAVAGACASIASLSFMAVPVAGASDIAISQFYTSGGEAGATYRNDYVELFNRSVSPVNVTGWSLQLRIPPVLEWAKITDLSGTIAPGSYYLVKLAGNTAGNGAELPSPDALGVSPTLGLANFRGSLVLLTTMDQYFCGPSTPWVDRVTYGSTACPEGTEVDPPVTFAALRAGGGCTDTDDNLSDFSTGAPVPRNSSTPPTLCAVLGISIPATRASARLGPVRPNPSASATEFAFTLARDGLVRLDVFDPHGRRTHTLVNGWRPAGEHRASWDGNLEDGAPAPAGVYFARFEVSGERVRDTRRFVRIR